MYAHLSTPFHICAYVDMYVVLVISMYVNVHVHVVYVIRMYVNVRTYVCTETTAP